MATSDRERLWSGFWATSLGTLASRVLGLVRDMATAALLGEGSVMDAFVVAFRVPNLLRRVFGEGALAASYIPVFAARHQRDPRGGWRLASTLLAVVALCLAAVALIGEAICGLLWWSGTLADEQLQLVGLTAALLPYMVLICLAAQASATLQALLEFRVPAVAPALLNVCWLAAAWGVAPLVAPDKAAQAYVIAGAILISGVLQFGVQLPALGTRGFRFEYDWRASRGDLLTVARSMLPITLGMAVTQLNTLMDSLIAWCLSAPAGAARTVEWLGGVAYPMRAGAAATIYYGERFYQLPVGLLGLAVATTIYPLLARHAARADRAQIGVDLTLGLRLVIFTALPAGIGMMLVAEPLVRLLFERGEFTADDTARTARTIACYASGVWAYCALPVLVRGFYASGDRLTPARIGLWAVGLNLALNLALVWPLAENGLAISTSIAAGMQVLLLGAMFSRTASPLAWRKLAATVITSAIAAGAMSAAVIVLSHWLFDMESSRPRQAGALAITIGLGVIVYLAVSRAVDKREPGLSLLRWRGNRPRDADFRQ